MKSKILSLLIMQVMISGALLAQSNIKVLKIGDYLSLNTPLEKIVNYKSKSGTLADFKAKLIILDFWATWCGPCVASLPKMDSLQKKYKDKISIIGVNGRERGDNAVKSGKYLNYKGFSIPSVVEDDKLHEMFEIQSLPTEIWISETGQVLAITREDQVTAKNIEEYLKSGKLSVSSEKDDVEKKMKKSLDPISESKIESIYQSLITGRDGETGGTQVDYFSYRPGMIKTYSTINLGTFHLYGDALSMHERENPTWNPTRFFIETKDSTFRPLTFWEDLVKYTGTDRVNYFGIPKYFWNEDGKSFCYSVKFPSPGILDSIFYRKHYLDDLNKCFEFKGRVEKRKIPSWVIVKMNKTLPAISSQNDDSSNMIIYDQDVDKNYIETVQNLSLDALIVLLTTFTMDGPYYMTSPPIYNETGYNKEKITLKELHLKFHKESSCMKPMDLKEWKAAFNRNGLDIKLEDRETEVMILSNKLQNK